MNNYQNNISKHRRFKYGALAVSLTVVVIALVVVVNAVFTALAQKFSLYGDMTSDKLYGITQDSKDLLASYRGTAEFSISIIFCNDGDLLDSEYSSRLVHSLAKEYQEEFDFVSVEYIDIVNHPEAVNKYLNTTASAAKSTSVYIVKHDLTKPDQDVFQVRAFSIESFYTVDSETQTPFAFNGEYKITAAILQLAGDSPIAYFVSGHGESSENSVMWELFVEAGYDVRTIDLSKEDIDKNAKVVVINNPKKDFMGANDTVNEIKKIDNFLDNFGGLMVFMDQSAGKTPELDELLAEWGIKFEDKQIRDYTSSISTDGLELVAEYTTSGNGASVTSAIRNLPTVPKTIVKNCRPITYTFDRMADNEYGASFSTSQRTISSILTTSSDKTAQAIGTDSSENGIFNLMTISVDEKYIDNEPHYSYVVAAGTTSFADNKYIGSSSYANRDIIFNIMKNFGKKTVPLDMDFKEFEDQSLSITKGEANTLTAIITVAPSLIVCIVGIVVYRRRHYK